MTRVTRLTRMKSIFSPTRYRPWDCLSTQNLFGHLQGGSSAICLTWKKQKQTRTLETFPRAGEEKNLEAEPRLSRLTASSSSFPVLLLLGATLVGVGDGEGEGAGETGGDGGRRCAGDSGDGAGGGASSSSSISFSSLMRPGGSTWYLDAATGRKMF